ncbi:MAG: PepSY domain-containing protein [Halothiobacillus sp.]|jgi:uncharacterized membrane protein YkoI|nr:PepSY domain-containing protein [Halothiobacillus sp.]
MKSRYIIATITGVSLSLMGIVGAQAYSGETLAKHAKVSMTEAQGLALKAHPGTITDQELEKEGGGSGLRYSFDIKGTDKVVYEIGVDAQTGAVLENDKESANPD